MNWPRIALTVTSVTLLLAACGGTSTSTAAGGGGAANPSPSPVAGSDVSGKIGSFTGSIASGKNATFKATYASNGGGSSQNITIEQQPPASAVITSTGSFISDGTKSYFCSTSSGATVCITAAAGTNPASAIVQAFSPDTVLGTIHGVEAMIAAKAAGVNVSFSTQTFAGQDADCMTVTQNGQTAKYCVTHSGILAYAGTDADNFQLTDFSSSVSASDFQPPPGATIQ